jgi:Protein of unknown function (DUF2950)
MEAMMKTDDTGRKTGGMARLRVTAILASLLLAASQAGGAGQRDFVSPEDAAQALVQAVKAQDRGATLSILGPDADAWISSGDPAADRASVARFAAAYDEQHRIALEGDKAVLMLGRENFPFAFPVARSSGRWRFDTEAGRNEMLARRIGANELGAIQVLQAIVDAQLEYASEDRDGDGIPAYAQKFASSPGKRDGLYWPQRNGEAQSPLGELMVRAADEGYQGSDSGPTPYHGYFYRILTGQGAHAPSGAIDYVVRGRAIGGFAVIAYPARYGNSGIMSFVVSQDAKIYQADLGPDTQEAAARIRLFDPGPGWSPAEAR